MKGHFPAVGEGGERSAAVQVGKAAISVAIAASVPGAGATTATAAPAPRGGIAAKCDYERRPGGGWLYCWKTEKGTQKSASATPQVRSHNMLAVPAARARPSLRTTITGRHWPGGQRT